MIRLRNASVLFAAATMTGCGALVPSSHFGIPTRGVASEHEVRVLEVARQLSPMLGGSCVDAGTDASIPCSLLPLHALAYASASGDKHAQLELGKRFETGRGLERDLIKAEKLYKRAAATSGGPMSTCIWNEHQKACNFIQIHIPYSYGLPEAGTRLAKLRERMAETQNRPVSE